MCVCMRVGGLEMEADHNLPLLSPHVISLQALQHRILQRIRALESALHLHSHHVHPPLLTACSNGSIRLTHLSPRTSPDSSDEDTVQAEQLRRILHDAGVSSFELKKVPSDYYERSYEERRDLLGAASVDHLCKSIVMVNTQAHENVRDCSDINNSKYYVVVVQYIARLNAEKVKQYVYSLNERKIPKKRFNMRLAPEEEAYDLTGFAHNAVTPIGMKTRIPVILSDAITKLHPQYFWLGGGEVNLKLGISTEEFIRLVNPFVVDCTSAG